MWIVDSICAGSERKMINQLLFLTSLCLAAGSTGPPRRHEATATQAAKTRVQQHSFGIYLTKGANENLITASTNDLSRVVLVEEPVISDADIIFYDFTNHLMRITVAAMNRIPEPNFPGTPFVIVADRQRIYLGAFTTPVSSFSVSIPSIWFMKGRYQFVIPGELAIHPGYSFRDHDPRSDFHIKDALAALGKLKQAPTNSEPVSVLPFLFPSR